MKTQNWEKDINDLRIIYPIKRYTPDNYLDKTNSPKNIIKCEYCGSNNKSGELKCKFCGGNL